MAKFHLPKAQNKPKDYHLLPWTDQFKCEYPVDEVKKMMHEQNIPIEKLVNHLNFNCKMDRNKAELISNIIENDIQIIRNDQEVNLVINLPFCIWRCFNCKNVMYDKEKNQDIYPYFFDALLKEIETSKTLIKNKCYMVKNISFTGNILALENDKIEKLFQTLNYSFCDISVEVGAPSFVTDEKLALLKKYNVSRIVFNSLTFNTVTLRKLCRRFEFKEIYDAYSKIVGYGFLTSFEFVVGLLDEQELQLSRNIDLACDLGASNIDLYACFCRYNIEQNLTNKQQIVQQRQLLDFANRCMLEHGYNPYFLYCTQVENACFENVGWTLPGQENKFLKDKVERISTTIGCGTSAESLLVKNIGNKKINYKNPYDISQYVFGIDEIIKKKENFFN